MKLTTPLTLTAIATATAAVTLGATIAKANLFGNQEVADPNAFAVVATPFGNNQFSLLIMEQIPGKQQCWAESGINPTIINPLWTTFDFSGHCKRYADGNGYSIRINGEDFALDYLLRTVWRNGEVMLVGTPRVGSRAGLREILIARTGGGVPGSTHKLYLVEGWRLTRRTYQGKTLGHMYFTNDGNLTPPPTTDPTTPTPTPTPSPSPTPTPTPSPSPSPTPTPTPSSFRDITSDIYRTEIEQAVGVGFISGFPEDNTFRPLATLTREQLVSMVLDAMTATPNVNPNAPQATVAPFPDVAAGRWSAAKIQWAKTSGIVTGYPDGTFKPTQPVTRAELMVVMEKAAQYAKAQQNQATTLTATQSVFNFTDTSTHWANDLIARMSAYCGVATPVNEQGTAFAPNSPALRNYAAAATLRMFNCVKAGQ